VLKKQTEEKEKNKPHEATLEHFKNQKVFNINQIRKKYIERHDKIVTLILLFFSEDQDKFKNEKIQKIKQLLHIIVNNKKHIWGKTVLLCLYTVHLYRRSTFAIFWQQSQRSSQE